MCVCVSEEESMGIAVDDVCVCVLESSAVCDLCLKVVMSFRGAMIERARSLMTSMAQRSIWKYRRWNEEARMEAQLW